MARLIVPAYLAAETPWEGSGKSGTAEDWEYARSHVAHAVDRDGSFLDIGCANGYLLECLPRWTPHQLDRYGVDIAPGAGRRCSQSAAGASGAAVGGQCAGLGAAASVHLRAHWAGVRAAPSTLGAGRAAAGLVPAADHRRLQRGGACPADRGDAEFVGGHTIIGRSERANRKKPEMDYRVLWIDAS